MRPFGSSLASSSIGTPKLTSSHESNPMMGNPLGSSHVSSQKQNREGVDVGPLRGWIVTSHIAQGSGSCKPYILRESNPMLGDLLGNSRVSSQKQNREGVVGPKANNIVLRWSRAWDVMGARAGM
ncbi:unnamed protein product [Malus baccata var. baccata]